MRISGAGFKLRMELCTQEPGMSVLGISTISTNESVRQSAADSQTAVNYLLTQSVVYFITVMTFVVNVLPCKPSRSKQWDKLYKDKT